MDNKKNNQANPLQTVNSQLRASPGFTLMEIIVATAIFATTISFMLVLFTYSLRVNRTSQALRQATQGTRNFVEYLVREIRNGTIDYSGNQTNCPASYQQGATAYLAVQNQYDGPVCLFLTGTNLSIRKNNGPAEILNPPDFKIDYLQFYVRPICDPFTQCYSGVYPKIQPFVTLVARFTVRLPTGETVSLPYQTTVSTDAYNIPSTP